MAFQQGLSGLASSSQAINVVSNNIANAATVGFKSSAAQFSDVYAASLTGSVASTQVGIGSSVASVRQAFTQGGLTTTGNPLDLAINGNGFFEVTQRDGSLALTRSGQFDIDSEGYIVTAIGDRLMGFQEASAAAGGVIAPEQPSNANYTTLRIPTTGVSASATTAATITVNLGAAEEVPAVVPPSVAQPDSYNYTTSVRVFDSLGVEHSLSFYFVKSADPLTWQVFSSLDGAELDATPLGSIVFDNNGLFSQTLDDANAPIPGNLLTLDGIDFGNDSALFGTTVDFSGSTQFSSASAIRDLDQNGYTDGEVIGVSVDKAGVISGRYSNGETVAIGIVSLGTVRNPNGLTSLGNNLWRETTESGQVARGPAGTGLNGVLSAGVVEESNVDLTQELVQLIIMQRNYQANAQSIRTQDQLLQTVVNLR